MQLLVVSDEDRRRHSELRPDRLVAALSERGHEVHWRSDGPGRTPPPPGVSRSPWRGWSRWSAAGRCAARLWWSERPPRGHGWAILLDHRHLDGGTDWVPALRGAAACLTLEPSLSPLLWRRFRTRISVLGGGSLDVASWPPLSSDSAKKTLGLPADQRIVALTGRLDASVRTDLLALAHRKLAGVGLIVVGEGPADTAVAAMPWATRPSSPVLHVPSVDPRARHIALAAANVALYLGTEGLSEDAFAAAAMGRKLVALEQPDLRYLRDLYPGSEFVFEATATPEGLHKTMSKALSAPPLSPSAVANTRVTLDRRPALEQLVEIMTACASRS